MEDSLMPEGETNQQLSPLLDKPWRQLTFTDETRTELLKNAKEYETLTVGVAEPKILLIGQTKAGKSSFFNSVNSVFRGYPIFQATSSLPQKHGSKYCRTYTVSDTKGGKRLPFTFCDIMGLDPSDEKLGIHTQDILDVIRGHIPDNYEFSPKQAMGICEACIVEPSLANKVHCIVYIIDAKVASIFNEKLQTTFQTIFDEAQKQGIPQLVLLTKIDLACDIVKEDLIKVYESRHIHEIIMKTHEMVGVPVSCIFPVRNYWFEDELDMNVDILILKALQHILRQADAFFDEGKQRGKINLPSPESVCSSLPEPVEIEDKADAVFEEGKQRGKINLPSPESVCSRLLEPIPVRIEPKAETNHVQHTYSSCAVN